MRTLENVGSQPTFGLVHVCNVLSPLGRAELALVELLRASHSCHSHFIFSSCPLLPANWMLRVITDEDFQDAADVYLQSEEYAALQEELDDIKSSPDENLKIEFDSEFAASKQRRRQLVSRRLQLIYWRSPAYNLARIIVSLVIAFVLGSVFIAEYDPDVYTETQLRARLAVIFLSFTILGIMAILAVLPVMTKIRDMFYRQRDAGMYDSASLGLALGTAEKYFIVLSTALFVLVFLATSGIGDGKSLIGFWVSLSVSK